jgi:NAD(P)-dependent dehydrogenase (short-subunit alcohol dehydrogenase family)
VLALIKSNTMSFLDFVRNQRSKLPAVPPPPPTITAATYIVTGANTGIGLECVKHLVAFGAARVILAVRSREKGNAALAAIRAATGRPDAGEIWDLDLASLASVEAFASRVDALDRLDGLIENASIAMARFKAAEDMELSILVNVVSTMLLAARALPKLQATARRFGMRTHLVVVASDSAIASSMKGTVERHEGDVFDALSGEKSFAPFTQ